MVRAFNPKMKGLVSRALWFSDSLNQHLPYPGKVPWPLGYGQTEMKASFIFLVEDAVLERNAKFKKKESTQEETCLCSLVR